jgi:hypothetical protein
VYHAFVKAVQHDETGTVNYRKTMPEGVWCYVLFYFGAVHAAFQAMVYAAVTILFSLWLPASMCCYTQSEGQWPCSRGVPDF